MAFSESDFVIKPVLRTDEEISDIHDPWPPVSPSAPWSLVNTKFNQTMTMATDMLTLLVGESGDSGYLGELGNLISSYSIPDSVTALSIDIDDVAVSTNVGAPPDRPEGVITDFGTFDKAAPVPIALPAIDIDSLIPAEPPTYVPDTSIAWSEVPLNNDIYSTLLSRIQTELVNGSTGIDPTVEQETYDRAVARQDIENDRTYREIEDYFASRGFTLPPGAMAGRLQEAAATISRNNTEINGKIMIEQADLAQKNSHMIMQASLEFEKVLRDTRSAESDRSLDRAKTLSTLSVQYYAEAVRRYIGIAEANKAYIEAQVEYLKGVVDYNKGQVDVYRGEIEAFGIGVEAKAKTNSAIVETYKGEVTGYEVEVRAASQNQLVLIENNKAKIAKAEILLREQLGQIESALKAFEIESNLKERIANDKAALATQAVASALNAVNASATLGYSGGESRSESFDHSESVSQSTTIGQAVHESHNFTHGPLA